MRFAVFTNVLHHRVNGQYYGYAPYIREMNLWLKQVDEVEIVSHLSLDGKGDISEIAYAHDKIKFSHVPVLNFQTYKSVFLSIIQLPIVVVTMLFAMARADHLHLRCPGNIGLIACILQIFFPFKKKSAKYAGNWDPRANQPFSYKMQRWILSNTLLTRNMTVLVYGTWPNANKNIQSFFTASFSEKEIYKVPEKAFIEPYIFLFVGNLVLGKRPLESIRLAQELSSKGIDLRLDIYGNGPEMEKLLSYCKDKGIGELITFKGNCSLDQLKAAYKDAHFLILPSISEGWPKAVAEAMFFGCIPLVTPVSCVPWMIGLEKGQKQGQRGIILNDKSIITGQLNIEESGERILEVIRDGNWMTNISTAAKDWSWNYTTERFELEISAILDKRTKL